MSLAPEWIFAPVVPRHINTEWYPWNQGCKFFHKGGFSGTVYLCTLSSKHIGVHVLDEPPSEILRLLNREVDEDHAEMDLIERQIKADRSAVEPNLIRTAPGLSSTTWGPCGSPVDLEDVELTQDEDRPRRYPMRETDVARKSHWWRKK